MTQQFTAQQAARGALDDYRYQAYDFTVVDSDGLTFHVDCAIKDAADYPEDDHTFAPFNHWEGEDLYCEACGKPIPAIYGNPEEEK